MSGLSPYCCYMCPGLHRTAVISVRAFTVLLFYSYLNHTRTGLPMELSNYPPNTITKHLYLKSNAYIRLSQDRSNNWTQTESPVSLTHTSADITQATHAHVTIWRELINSILQHSLLTVSWYIPATRPNQSDMLYIRTRSLHKCWII